MPTKALNIATGNIRLQRENSIHTAACCIVNASLSDLQTHINDLHPRELATYESFKFDARKKAYLLGRLTARKALSLLVPKEKLSTIFIGNGVFSFPIVEGENCGLQVSITHCEDIGMAMVYPQAHPLGIDLERIDAKRSKTMAEQLSTKEKAIIRKAGLPKTIGYPISWTIKESLSKVLRTGLTLDFKFIELASIIRKGNYYESTFVKFGQYKAVSYHFGEYVCSIVLPKFTTPDLKELEGALDMLK